MTEPFHIHEPTYRDGGIGCRGCDQLVPKPPGMPDYSGASMATWQTWAEQAAARAAADMTDAGRMPEGYKVIYDLIRLDGSTPLPSVHGKIPEV